MCNAWVNLEKGRNRLALQQERLELDRQLVKAERKNHRRSNQIASQSQGTEIAKLEIQLKTAQQQHEHQMETMQNQLSAAQENGKMQEIEYRLKFQKQQEDAMEEASRRMMQDEAARRFLEENVESLQTKNHEMTQQLEQLEKLKKEQEQEIKRQTDELEDQLKEAKDELEHKSEEATRLTAQLANHASDTLAAQDEMDELQEELTQLRVDKNSSARKIQELESRLQNDPADDDDDDDEAMDELREQLETAQFERENYAMQVRKLDERCKTLESQQSNAVGTAAAAIGGTCANCEDLEEEVYELKLKLNKRQIEFQKELKELKRELEEAQNGGEKTIETVGTAGAAAVVTTKTAKELQEIRQIEVDKRKVEAKFLGLEALQKTTEKEKEAVEAELKETKADLFELAQELEKIQKEHRQVTMQRELDQDAMQEFKSQMDQLQTQQDTYESRLKKDTEEWNTLVDSLGQKQREVFDQTLPEIAKSVDDLEKQLVEVEQIKRKPPAPLPQKPPPAEENADRLDRRHSRRVSERRPPLTKMDSRKNRHVTEFDFQSNKQSGKYTGFLNMMQLPEGHGILRVDNGDVYEGEWENGRRHGQGGTLKKCAIVWANSFETYLANVSLSP